MDLGRVWSVESREALAGLAASVAELAAISGAGDDPDEFPGQRRRPPPGLGRRRHHRNHKPRPAMPETPRPQTRLHLDTRRSHQRQTTGLDLTLRTDLRQRSPGLGTTPLATPPPPHRRPPGRKPTRGCR